MFEPISESLRPTFARRSIRLCLQLCSVLILCCLVWPARVARADTFTVTSTADVGAGSLRKAITDANDNAGPDTILFSLGAGVQTIQPLSALPTITGQVEINALSGSTCTWPLAPKVELNGSSAGFSASGFNIASTASSSRIIGFYIHSFSVDGVKVDATDVIVGCNVIGLNPSGNAAGNGQYGVNIQGGSNIIGNNGSIPGNVISSNIGGVVIEPAVSGNIIRGNYIGTNIDGTQSRANQSAGITIVEASNTTIGGAVTADRNVISGNFQQGILFTFSGSGNTVMGNTIGLNAAGDAGLPNGEDGIKIQSTNNTTIGGPNAGEGNRIAFNTRNGVLITSGGTNNRVLGNEIFSNSQLGIDLSTTFTSQGVTFNDNGDFDSGTNLLQNFPVILEAAQVNANTVKVRGSLNSSTNSTYRIEIFSSPSCDASGFGEGATFLGSATLTTNFSGNGTFDVQLTKTVPLGHKITATATSNNGSAPGNTSEFSVCQSLVLQQPVTKAPQLLPDIAFTDEDNAVTIDVLANDSEPDDKPLTIVAVGVPNFGTAQIVGNQVRYTPPADFFGEATFTYSVHNGDTSNTRQSSVKVTVNSVNDIPTDVVYDGKTIDQDTPTGILGRLNMIDVEPVVIASISLVDAGTPNDNAHFLAFGSFLLYRTKLDFSNRTNITLGVRARDINGGVLIKNVVIPLPNINHIPDRINLSNNRINENQAAGATVGTLTVDDPDPGDTHTFALADGAGDSDNDSFRIEGTTLKTDALLDFEEKTVYSVRVRATDNGGQFRENILVITLNNLPAPPDKPINELAFCQGGTIPLITKNSSSVNRRVFVTIESVVISNLTGTGCTVNGKMKIVTNGNTISNLPFSGKVNSRNQFSSASIPDFTLSVAGLPIRAEGVEIEYISERPSLHITEPAIVMPKEFGGLSAEVSVPTQIDTSGLRFGTGTINLPSISTKSGFELSLAGSLEPSGEGFKISADGTIGIPNIKSKKKTGKQACAISAGVTIFADSSGNTVMVIAAGKDYRGDPTTTVIASTDPNADPNVFNGPDAVEKVRLDSVRAGASCSPGLAIGTTGLFLTGLSGEITVTPGEERVDVAVTIESGKELPGIGPMLAIDGEMGLRPKPFKLDIGAAIQVLSIEVGRADASITKKSFKASMSFRSIGYFGSVRIAAFSKSGRPTFTGSGKITLGVEKHAVFFLVPPIDVKIASVSADVGEFTNGNFGFKGNVDVLGLATVGFFIDHKGTLALGNVGKFKLISGPKVAAAHAAYRQAMAAGTTVDSAISSNYIFLDDGNGGSSGVIIRAPLVRPTVASGGNTGEVSAAAVTDVITQVNLLQHGDVIFNLASHGPITMTLITPQSQEVTPTNVNDSGTLGYTMAYTKTLSYQPVDTLDRIASGDTAIDEDETLAHLLFTPLDSSAGKNNVDLKIDGTTVYFDLTFQNAITWLKPIPLAPGDHTVQLIKHGTSDVVLETTVTLITGTSYSFLSVGGTSAGFATVEDDYAEPETMGKAKIRFYNGASSTISMTINGATQFTGIGYKAASAYAEVDAGTATIELHDNGTGALVSLPLVMDLADGGVYTFFATDYTADGFDIAIVQRQDAIYAPTYLTYYTVDQAVMNEEWQIKLLGDTDNIPYQISILGPSSPSILGSVMVDASNLAATNVSWQLTSDIQPVTVTVYANPAEITAGLVVSNTDDTTSTVEIPVFEGIPVGEFKITSAGELGGQLVTKQVDLSDLESGTYHLWVRADDGVNAPVNAYASSAVALAASGVQSAYGYNAAWTAKSDYSPLAQLADAAAIEINRESDFPTTWTAVITTTFAPETNSLQVEWRANSHPDADSYRLLFGHTALSPTTTLEVGGAIAEFDDEGASDTTEGFVILEDIMPGVPYFISIEAVDTETDKSVRSQEVEFIAVAGGFSLTSSVKAVKMDAGDSTTVPVTLVADETLFFPKVWLSTNLGDTPPGITARFLESTDGDTELSNNAPTGDLEISVDASVPDGVYPIVITGYNGDARQALTLEVTVGDPVTGVYMPLITR